MFSREGYSRTDRQNRLLAGCLALVSGFANSVGFVLVGVFTSHVTGSVGRLASEATSGNVGPATGALTMVLAFFFGAFLVSVMLESGRFGHLSRAYASALTVEGFLLSAFAILTFAPAASTARAPEPLAALLCMAMGMQNGLVTRISGAVVRTTHLTGVITDLGIESARWFRYWRAILSARVGVPLIAGPNTPQQPLSSKIELLATIAFAFSSGAILGAVAATRVGRSAMLFAIGAVFSCAFYAFRKGRLLEENIARTSRR